MDIAYRPNIVLKICNVSGMRRKTVWKHSINLFVTLILLKLFSRQIVLQIATWMAYQANALLLSCQILHDRLPSHGKS